MSIGRGRGTCTRFTAVVALSFALLSIPGAASALNYTVRDEFSTVSYSGSDGTFDWTGPWVELGETDGPSAGTIDVSTDSRCAVDTCLRIGGTEADVNDKGVWREVNLATALSATLIFSYRRALAKGTGSVTLSISSNGGATWSTLSVYDFAGSANQTDAVFDVTPYIGKNTRIRFLASGSSVTNSLYFDNIEIAADFPVAAVTTTTTATTTTSAATTTTTTTTAAATTTTTAATTTSAATTTTTTAATTTSAATTTTTTTAATTTSAATTTTAAAAFGGADPQANGRDDIRSGTLLSPIRDLSVTFNTTVEALGENAIPAIVLGVLVSWLAVLGVEQRDSRRRRRRERALGRLIQKA